MTDLERLLEAEAKLTPEPWSAATQMQDIFMTRLNDVASRGEADAEGIVFIRNHLRPVLELSQRIEEAARAALETLEPQFSHWGCVRALRTVLSEIED